jgi:hypothetical protein
LFTKNDVEINNPQIRYNQNISSVPLLLHINLDPIYNERLSKYLPIQTLQAPKERKPA